MEQIINYKDIKKETIKFITIAEWGFNLILFGIILICVFFLCQPCFAFTKWEDSPYNWNNAEHNWQNSSTNWRNSPGNWNNSRYNPNANIIYDSQGQAQGYAVPKQNGTGVNVYDFNGKRQGYYNY